MNKKNLSKHKNMENPPNFNCEICSFKCDKNSDFIKHLNTRKHKNEVFTFEFQKHVNNWKCSFCLVDEYDCVCKKDRSEDYTVEKKILPSIRVIATKYTCKGVMVQPTVSDKPGRDRNMALFGNSTVTYK
jgi:spore coat polysaccharide biosynthesis protein SpsF (cytidylyltransferase family)